ncbi:MAG TPA: hypothetical protein ENL04_01675 [Sulfuricurvum sp.]|nr:hypothetical protein [Sulfuricurvum sp.]
MVEKSMNIVNEGKRSLDSLLREKAYEDVVEKLHENGIDPETVSDEDMEALVAAKVQDMQSVLKGFGYGAAFAVVLSAVIGF